MRNKIGKICVILGLSFMAAALGLACYNLREEKKAEESANVVLKAMEEEKRIVLETLPEFDSADRLEEVPGYVMNPDMEMPVMEIDGNGYIGTLEIPALQISLPVMSEWSYPKLKIAPCRYQGSVYKGTLIVAGHNYTKHFGNLKTLSPGDRVIFTDAENHLFSFVVSKIEVLENTAIEEMESGDWALTLFTCTTGGKSRVTVRCVSDN